MNNFNGLRYKRTENSVDNMEDLKKVLSLYAGVCPKCKLSLSIKDINEDVFLLECKCGFRKKITMECISK